MTTEHGFPDAVAAAPDIYRVVAEDDRVRVLEIRMPAGAKSAMHYHPRGAAISFGPASLRISFPDGSGVDATFGAQQAFLQPAGPHGGENVGTTEGHAILVELKE
jgi:beta-alanine degradation protein BauB